MKIKDVLASKSGDLANGLEAIVTKASSKMTKTNKPYVTGELTDDTGTVKFNVWEGEQNFAIMNPGTPIIVALGGIDIYEGTYQVTIRVAHEIPKERAEAAGIVPASQYRSEDLSEKFEKIITLIESEGAKANSGFSNIRKVLTAMEADGIMSSFRVMPAAKKMHQAYIRGLWEHCILVATLAYRMASAYQDRKEIGQLDMGLLLTAAVFHDIGKTLEYTTGPLGLVNDYSLNGGLAGHLVTGARLLRNYWKDYLSETDMDKLEHIILAHHGKKEWGSPVEPKILEAQLVHLADMTDASFGIFTAEVSDKSMWVYNHRGDSILNPNYIGSAFREERGVEF